MPNLKNLNEASERKKQWNVINVAELIRNKPVSQSAVNEFQNNDVLCTAGEKFAELISKFAG